MRAVRSRWVGRVPFKGGHGNLGWIYGVGGLEIYMRVSSEQLSVPARLFGCKVARGSVAKVEGTWCRVRQDL